MYVSSPPSSLWIKDALQVGIHWEKHCSVLAEGILGGVAAHLPITYMVSFLLHQGDIARVSTKMCEWSNYTNRFGKAVSG